MGCTVDFVCPACGYQAHVSGGGDAGFISVTETFVCENCRKLFDAAVERRKTEESPFVAVLPRCPVRKSHRIRPWRHPGPCPRCAATLSPYPEKGMTLWD